VMPGLARRVQPASDHVGAATNRFRESLGVPPPFIVVVVIAEPEVQSEDSLAVKERDSFLVNLFASRHHRECIWKGRKIGDASSRSLSSEVNK